MSPSTATQATKITSSAPAPADHFAQPKGTGFTIDFEKKVRTSPCSLQAALVERARPRCERSALDGLPPHLFPSWARSCR